MLNVKAITDLFTQNVDDKLCKQWWLMTPNGTLLAHSKTQDDDQTLRRQAATVTVNWHEHAAALSDNPDGQSRRSDTLEDRLRTLTIEGATNNFIATRVQPQLLLVLEGGVPPRRPGFEEKATSEGPDDPQYPSNDDPATNHFSKPEDSAPPSRANSITNNAATTILRMQRRKLEAMANTLADKFEQSGFKMPSENGSVRFF